MGGSTTRRASWSTLVLAAALAGAAPAAEPFAWRAGLPEQPPVVLVRGATVWTCGPAGTIAPGDLLVRAGRIAAVGYGLEVPARALVIEARGKHLTPGIIDAHSHTAVDGSVNEGSNVTTAEVRIADVLNPEDPSIYRQLAGGVTAANVLHGSANSIGGQNAVIKLRWGALPEQLLFDGAPPGIKFAVGENPKQSNFQRPGVPRRYPQSRGGVEQSIRERFLAAQDYQRSWREFERARDDGRVPPRRDLQLEAIAEILDGRRLVHAHSYRADEILMLLRVAEEFGVRIATLQHVLEGYKVAAEIAAHGAGASTFSDWWAYKFEVRDAIPWNGAIMWKQGVVVSFNSDSDELARRLNLEAAKAVRYGGVPEEDALEFVTANPARQLRIDQRVGTLAPDKDADFVIWSGSPLSSQSVAEQTWIDGRRYFDRAEDLAGRSALAEERAQLLAKAKAARDKKKNDDKKDETKTGEGAAAAPAATPGVVPEPAPTPPQPEPAPTPPPQGGER